MTKLSKALSYIQPSQSLPNFTVRLENYSTDFQTFKANKWTVLFNHPEHFIPKNIYGFKKFLELQHFLKSNNAKLIGLNPEDLKVMDSCGKNCKIIVVDPKGIVRSIVAIRKMDYKLVKSILKSAQDNQPVNYSHFPIAKTDQSGFPPVGLFYKNKRLN